LPLIKEKKILVLFPYTGNNIFRKKELDHIIHLRTSYAEEAKALIQHAVESLGIKRLALFYQNDSYGQAALEGARAALKKYCIDEFIETSYERNSPNIDIAAEEIKKFSPAAILFFSTNAPSMALIQTLGMEMLANQSLLGISFLTDIFRNFLRMKGLELIISRVIPDIHENKLPIVREYHQAIKDNFFGGLPSEDSFEGYINSRLLTTVLESIEPPYTKEKLIKEFESIRNYNFLGMKLDFDSHTRELYKEIWIDTGKSS
jgi:branched-chain amino acid transport system substrate-binding protein